MTYRITGILTAMLMSGIAAGQTPSAAPTSKVPVASTRAAKPSKAPVVRTAKSLDCSKQADAKGLHGKPRKGFMSSCKKA